MHDLILEYVQLIGNLEELREKLNSSRDTAARSEFITIDARIKAVSDEILELYDAVNEMIRGVRFGDSI